MLARIMSYGAILKNSKLIQDSIIPFNHAHEGGKQRRRWWGEREALGPDMVFFEANVVKSDGVFIEYSLLVNTGYYCSVMDQWKRERQKQAKKSRGWKSESKAVEPV